mgnify:CR=1 FL=1
MSRISADFDVYWNLHQHRYSILNRKTSRVEDHQPTIYLAEARFVVREAGREKVLKEKRKNVHAFVRGELCSEGFWKQDLPDCGFGDDNAEFLVRYDPYLAPFFFDAETKREVTSAYRVRGVSVNGATTINGLLHDVPRPRIAAKGLTFGERFVEGYAK